MVFTPHRSAGLRAAACAASLALAGAGAAAEPPAQEEAAADEQELLELLAEETDLATKTRMNSDYVPGIVSVLHADELETLGVQTVWEALSLVPGIQLVRDQHASPSLTVRGIDFIFNTGNTKVLVNGVSMSRESAGVNSSILYLPIEQVERIEMIRGPGSAIHGDFAFSGMINIVTRKDRDRVVVRATRPDGAAAIVEQGWSSKGGAVTGSVSIAGLTSREADAPRPFDAAEERRSALVGVDGKFGWFRGQFVSRDWSPGGDPAHQLDEENRAAGWGGRFELGSGWSIDAHAAWSSTSHDTLPRRLFDGDAWDVGSDFLWSGKRNDVLAGVSWWSGDIDHAIEVLPPPAPTLDVRGSTRTIRGITFQEQFRATPKLTVTAGARYDEFSDIGGQLSPRFAIVWRPAERHVIKAQHARAFRAPTFFELAAPSPDPDAENIATTELGWVHRRPSAVVRATAFRSELDDGLGPGPGGPSNARSATVTGLEAEWTQSFGEKVKLVTNVSYVDPTEDSIVFGWSRWLGNVAVVASPTERFVLGMRWYHVGDRETPVGDTPGYDWVDVTFTFDRVGADGARVRFGVKNALAHSIAHPIPTPFGVDTPTYDDRTFWASFAWTW